MQCQIKYLVLFWLVICQLTFIVAESEIADFVYCRPRGYSNGMSPDTAIGVLKTPDGRPCTYVEGTLDLLIPSRYSDSVVDKLLPYLSKVQVITGSLKIMVVDSNYLQDIKFDNLRTIKGEPLTQFGAGLSIGTYNSYKLRELIFPRLNAILNGEVHIRPNNGDFCKREMYWPEITKDPKTKYYDLRSNCKHTCHSSCPKLGESEKRYCSGPDPDQCQLASRCKERKSCSHCFIVDGSEECCNEQCVAGCNGPTAKDCFTCANKWYKGECVSFCPPGTVHRSGLCLERCPSGFVVMGSECVDSCGFGYVVDQERVCTKCNEEEDCKGCTIANDDGQYVDLEKKHLPSLVNCTHLYGSLLIGFQSFKSIDSVDDFLALSNLKYIEGNIMFNFLSAPQSMLDDPRMKSLFFLQNLEVLVGAYSNDKKACHWSYIAEHKSLIYPGLASLQSIMQTEYIFFYNCPNIKFAFTPKWKTLGANRVVFNVVSKENGTCDPECRRIWGCWGPGPYQCRKCANHKLTYDNNRCVANCEDWGNYFNDDTSVPEIYEFNCKKCHEECDGCTGEKPTQCKKCKHFKIAETGECVSKGNVVVVESVNPVKAILFDGSECPEGYKTEIVTNKNRNNLEAEVVKHLADSGISLVCRSAE